MAPSTVHGQVGEFGEDPGQVFERGASHSLAGANDGVELGQLVVSSLDPATR